MMNKLIPITLLGLLASCSGGSTPPAPQPVVPQPPASQGISLSMDAGAWQFQYSPGMPPSPRGDPEGFAFDFPPANGVHYLAQPVNGRLGTVSSSFRVERSNAQLAEVEPCSGSRPMVRIMFQRRGDTLAAGTVAQPTVYVDYRWWGVQAYDLGADGPGSLTIPADPARWSNVFGQNGADRVTQWQEAANNVGAVALTFGGCFAGHGLYKTGEGTVTFKVHSVTAKD